MKKKGLNCTLSVVIPIKDAYESLVLCVKSIFKQSVFPDEIYIIGKKIDIDLFKKRFKVSEINKIDFIELDVDKNDARNAGIEKSKSTHILYLDHDMRLSRDLIKDLKKKASHYDALVIPERGMGTNYYSKIKKLERNLIMYDSATTTPRFYRKNLFSKEKPFSDKFGLLDEWGFGQRLKSKKAKVSVSSECIYVDEGSVTVINNFKKKFKRGLWMKKFLDIDKDEALRRTNPISRGIKFYLKNFGFFIQSPIIFTSLILLKFLDLTAFFVGFITGIIFPPKKFSEIDAEKQFFEVHDKLGKKYLQVMFKNSKWSKYIDLTEKQSVKKSLKIVKNKVTNEIVLDMGVGPGRWSRWLIDEGFGKVVGLDISSNMVKESTNYIKNDRFVGVVGNIDNLPFLNSYFDKIICFRTFKYSQRPLQCLREARRVLKKDGIFLLEVSNNSLQNIFLKLFSKIYLYFFPNTKTNSRIRYFSETEFYSKERVITLAKKANLKNTNNFYLFVLPSVSLPRKVDCFLYPLLKLFDNVFFAIMPRKLFSRSIVFLFKK